MGKIPGRSHHQFLVLGTLRTCPLAGREIRDRLDAFGVRTRGPAFYQLMARLEDNAMVKGSYHQEVIEGQIIRERHYQITSAGTLAWTECSHFYLDAIRDFGAGGEMARAQG